VSETIQRVKRYCDIAGMEPSDPLRLALITTCEAAERVERASQSESVLAEHRRFTSDMRKELPRVIREGTWNGTQRVLDLLQTKHMLIPVGAFIGGVVLTLLIAWGVLHLGLGTSHFCPGTVGVQDGKAFCYYWLRS
jgi:hypothetical protein